MLKALAKMFKIFPENETEGRAVAEQPPPAKVQIGPRLSGRARMIAEIGSRYNYSVEQEQQNIGLLILTKTDELGNEIQLNIYYTTMTVGTALRHPTKGRTQLFRRGVTPKGLEEIMKNPRTHTGDGYYEKKR